MKESGVINPTYYAQNNSALWVKPLLYYSTGSIAETVGSTEEYYSYRD